MQAADNFGLNLQFLYAYDSIRVKEISDQEGAGSGRSTVLKTKHSSLKMSTLARDGKCNQTRVRVS